jgi:spore coat polysaccharide biosynthesis protein SpsF (cytidylyltransferase family)
MHHTDACERLLETSVVPVLRDAGVVDEVVIAAADVPANDALEPFAAAWGVELFRGAELDVAQRIGDLAEARGAETVARVLAWWFFLDTDLVDRQLTALEGCGADALVLPRDFDMRFGADVFRPRFLERVRAALAEESGPLAGYRLNPWSFAEAFPERFELREFTDVPTLARDDFECIRAVPRRG